MTVWSPMSSLKTCKGVTFALLVSAAVIVVASVMEGRWGWTSWVSVSSSIIFKEAGGSGRAMGSASTTPMMAVASEVGGVVWREISGRHVGSRVWVGSLTRMTGEALTSRMGGMIERGRRSTWMTSRSGRLTLSGVQRIRHVVSGIVTCSSMHSMMVGMVPVVSTSSMRRRTMMHRMTTSTMMTERRRSSVSVFHTNPSGRRMSSTSTVLVLGMLSHVFSMVAVVSTFVELDFDDEYAFRVRVGLGRGGLLVGHHDSKIVIVLVLVVIDMKIGQVGERGTFFGGGIEMLLDDRVDDFEALDNRWNGVVLVVLCHIDGDCDLASGRSKSSEM